MNHTTAGKLTLWNNGRGAYVNRYGANGEQWIVTAQAYYCGNVGREMLDAAGEPHSLHFDRRRHDQLHRDGRPWPHAG